jgi:hypothetical protein
MRYGGAGAGAGSGASSGRGSPAPVRGYSRRDVGDEMALPGASSGGAAGGGGGGLERADSRSRRAGGGMDAPSSAAGAGTGGGKFGETESWKRAAEVTSQLKARIEQMKVSSDFPLDSTSGCTVLARWMNDS